MKGKVFHLLSACVVALSICTSCDEDYNFVDHFSDEQQASEGKMTLEGKENGIEDYHTVYVDLSEHSQFRVPRTSWDLGFYSGEGYHVTLNSSHKVVAAPSTKNDFAAVTLADAAEVIDLNDIAMTSTTSVVIDGSDDFSGDLDKTVFAEISEQAADNKVYFVVTETNSQGKDGPRDGWFKVRVTRNAEGGYHVEYGKVTDTTPRVVDIAKRAGYSFVGFSLDTERLVTLPQTGSWELMWGTAASSVIMPNGREFFTHTADVILVNHVDGVEVATVATSEVTYDDFTYEQALQQTYDNSAHAIGTSWRKPGGPGVSGGVKDDRFYVFKDAEGQYFKLRFLTYGSGDMGERGRPELEYQKLTAVAPSE